MARCEQLANQTDTSANINPLAKPLANCIAPRFHHSRLRCSTPSETTMKRPMANGIKHITAKAENTPDMADSTKNGATMPIR